MRSITCLVLALVASACTAHHSTPSGGTTGGSHPSGADYVNALLLPLPETSPRTPAGWEIVFFNALTSCAACEDPNSFCLNSQPLSETIDIVLGYTTPGTYSLASDANVSAKLWDPRFNDEFYQATAGTITITQTPNAMMPQGQSLAGSLNVSWDDNTTLNISSFTAPYCRGTTANFSGAFTVGSAFFDNSSGSLDITAVSRAVTCANMQDVNFLLAAESYELSISLIGNATGVYPLSSDGNNTATQYFNYYTPPYETTGLAGNVNVTTVNPNAVTVGPATITWDTGDIQSIPGFTATFCPNQAN